MLGWVKDRGRRARDNGMNSSKDNRNDRPADRTEADHGSVVHIVNTASQNTCRVVIGGGVKDRVQARRGDREAGVADEVGALAEDKAAVAGSKVQPGGSPWVTLRCVIGKVWLRERLTSVLE
jgi:hypothetical protein